MEALTEVTEVMAAETAHLAIERGLNVGKKPPPFFNPALKRVYDVTAALHLGMEG